MKHTQKGAWKFHTGKLQAVAALSLFDEDAQEVSKASLSWGERTALCVKKRKEYRSLLLNEMRKIRKTPIAESGNC